MISELFLAHSWRQWHYASDKNHLPVGSGNEDTRQFLEGVPGSKKTNNFYSISATRLNPTHWTFKQSLGCWPWLLCSITLPVFLCELLQVVLVEVLVTRRAENFLRQVADNRRGSGGNERERRRVHFSGFICLFRCLSGLCQFNKTEWKWELY